MERGRKDAPCQIWRDAWTSRIAASKRRSLREVDRVEEVEQGRRVFLKLPLDDAEVPLGGVLSSVEKTSSKTSAIDCNSSRVCFARRPVGVVGANTERSTPFKRWTEGKTGRLRNGSVFDGRNASRALSSDGVKLDRLAAWSCLSDATNDSYLCCHLPSHHPEAIEELGVLTGVQLSVPPDVDGAVQNSGACSKRPLQCDALRVAPVAHERLQGQEPRHKLEEPLECLDHPVPQDAPCN